MRIWDIAPGFLNDKSLLGEHRELHGLYSIHENQKKGYSRHPETLRWKNCLTGLNLRHSLLVEEMRLRGFNHKSPIERPIKKDVEKLLWPDSFIDQPHEQFALLKTKYENTPQGRIPLPKNIQELWAFHKYSVMARDPDRYRRIGPLVAQNKISCQDLSMIMVSTLRQSPLPGRLTNSLYHMWGYVSHLTEVNHKTLNLSGLIQEIRNQVQAHGISYLTHSTALGELGLWIP